MYDKGTLNITVDDVMNNPKAIATLDAKIKTSLTQLETWMKKSPKEYEVFHGRVMNMFRIISDSHPYRNHKSYMEDNDKSYLPADSDHMATPGLSWTARYKPSKC